MAHTYSKKAVEFFENKNYLKKGETLQDRINSIVDVVKRYEKDYSEGLSDRIKSYIEQKILIPSTPQWGNLGRKAEEGTTPLPASCYILGVQNSIQSIFYSFGETAMMSKLGGGIGANYRPVAQKGTFLSEGFYSNSKLDWIEMGVDTSQKVSQNALRRGYSTPEISIEDKDFYGLLERLDKKNSDKNDPLIKNNACIYLPIGFWSRLPKEEELQKRWLLLNQKRKSKGKIYIQDGTNCNINKSPVYENLNLEVDSTNICCVTGNQLVPTKSGLKTVKELSELNTSLELFDNEGVYNSTAMLYRGDADVYEISLKNGMSHTITSNHELVVRDYSRKKYRKSLDTGLSIGDKVCVQTNKGLFGKRNEPGLAFLLGLFLGDGNKVNTHGTQISLWENDFDLIEEVEAICEEFYKRPDTVLRYGNKLPKFIEANTGDSTVAKKRLITSIFNNNGFAFKKGEIPNWILDSDEETQWQLLRGLLYADGTVGDYNTGKSFGKPISLSLASIDLDMLRVLQIICSNLGLNVKIYNLREATKHMLPKNDGTGEYKEYPTKKIDRLILSNKTDLIKVEKNTKFLSRKNIFVEDKKYRDNSQKSSEIVDITYKGKQAVYCPTVDSDKHLWVCNGLVTSNTEALTASSLKDYSFVCMLSSLNLLKWDIIKGDPQIIKDCFMFLDINISEYIELTEGVPFLEKARQSAIDKRDIGLGTLGFHDLLQSKEMPFGSLDSRILNREIYSTIREQGNIYAKEVGEKLGSPKLCEDAGLTRRNVSLMMIAPNKSTASFADTSEGVQPRISNYMVEELAGISNIFKNKYLEKILEDRGQNNFEIWESIRKNSGSVQHLDFLTPKEKETFRTAVEISPKDIIDLASDRQEYIDMAQSINLWNRENYTLQDVLDIHKYALAGPDNTVKINGVNIPCRSLKTLYYFYPSGHAALEKGSSASWSECASCSD